MPSEYSFDIVADIDLAEVENAVNNALKQIGNRYDFKGKLAKLVFTKKEKKLVAEGSNDYIIEQMESIFHTALAKRGVDLKAVQSRGEEAASGGGIRKTYAICDTMSTEHCKKVTKAVKQSRLKKVKASIQGESVRVASPSKDDLQAVQDLVRGLNLDCPVQFTNYK